MTKEETLQLKGIAILMMLFLHLFNTTANVEQCQTYIYFWNGKPLVLALSRVAAFCVPIYIFLSGYGLAITYKQNQRIMRSWNRIFNLYINYWIVFLLFIPLACFIRPQNYPGNLTEFICNFIALDCSYNREWWFFFLMSCLLLVPNIYSTFWISWISKQLLQPSRCCAYYTLLQILSENLYSVPVNHYRLLHGILLFYSHSFAEPYSPVTTYLNISNLIFPDILLQRGIFY
ncbi:MAG: acyltransferase family protein [Phocaeicola massiliensis]